MCSGLRILKGVGRTCGREDKNICIMRWYFPSACPGSGRSMPDGGVAEAELLCVHSPPLHLCLGMGATLVEPLLGSGMGCSQVVSPNNQESGLDLRLGLPKPAGHSLPRERFSPTLGTMGSSHLSPPPNSTVSLFRTLSPLVSS